MGKFKTSIRISLFTVILAISVFYLVTTASAWTTIYVDDSNTGKEDGSKEHPFNTIREALKKASSNDTILVLPGTYKENIKVEPGREISNIKFLGSGVKVTNIVGDIDLEPISKVTGFTIKGNAEGWVGNIVIAHNFIKGRLLCFGKGFYDIHNNDVSGTIQVGYNDSPGGQVKNNRVYDGRGIQCVSDAIVVVEKNECYRNDVGILYADELAFVGNNNIHHNKIGIKMNPDVYPGNFTITRNRIWANNKGVTIPFSFFTPSTFNIINNLILNNGGPGIEVADVTDFTVNVINDTLVGNKGGIFRVPSKEGTADITIANCILWDNGDDLKKVKAVYSDIEDGDKGKGNISKNPKLDKKYCPTKSAPVIDKGKNSYVPKNIKKDIYGRPRIVDGNGDGKKIVDMGACEFQR